MLLCSALDRQLQITTWLKTVGDLWMESRDVVEVSSKQLEQR